MPKLISKRVNLAIKKLQKILLPNVLHRPNFPQQYNELTALKCTVAYNHYGGYCVPNSSKHRPAAKKILSNDIYEPETIEFMISSCGDGDIIHAGSYFGDFLPALSTGLGAQQKVWAFEPNPENYRCARITIELNNLKNVVLTNAGLGAKRGNLLMQIADSSGQALGGASRLIDKEEGLENPCEIDFLHSTDIVTIDEIVDPDRNVSIIQLDVEGYEKEALAGALKTIRRHLPIIILEVLPSSTLLSSDFFSEKILSIGYRNQKYI